MINTPENLNYFTFVAFLLMLFSSCSNLVEKNKPLATVYGNEISVEEFITRSEYSIRPDFCNENSIKDKKIILKNLILEKLISNKYIENNNLSKNQQDYITGRSNQALRRKLYSKVLDDSIKIQKKVISEQLNLVNREYDLSYIQIPHNFKKLNEVLMAWESDSLFTETYPRIAIFTKKLKWNEFEQKEVLDSLFIPEIQKNQIIGPFFIGKFSMFLKVIDWVERPSTLENETKFKNQRLTDYLKNEMVENTFLNFIKNVMKNKNIHFKKDSFNSFVNIFGENLIMNENQIIDLKLRKNRFNMELNDQTKLNPSDTLFLVGEELWTIKKLLDNIKWHPLVFRKYKMKKSEFPFQLKFAISDLVRDHYLTSEAYIEELNKNDFLINQNNMWINFFNCQNYLKEKFPNAISLNNWLEDEGFQLELNELIDENSKDIYINWQELEKLIITDIPFSAIYKNESYSNVTAEILPLTKSQHIKLMK